MAVVTKRTIWWQGLEQDITSRVSAGSSYTVSACVGVSGTFHGSTDVLATLRLVYQNADTDYLFISKLESLSLSSLLLFIVYDETSIT